MSDAILANLNASQRAAVSSAASTLAILAGPGSGKTHTLTSRTAWLLGYEGLQPWNVIVATFTVKAAREMKERIGKLIGNGMEAQLILGTFHSIARRYLVRYGHLIDIPKDFGIADSSDSLAIIKRIVKRHNLTIDAAAARSRISGRKAKGADYSPSQRSKPKSLEAQEFETCYVEYEDALKRSNLLDYDDLLLRCVELLRSHPSCVSNVEAVLIDEFQDTNLVQFDLMRLFAAHRKRVTIVGDPDQSIYGFRSAETKNFKRMLVQYPDTITVPLEENYRSSGAILLAALEVIRQDQGRIAKSLMPTHIVGTQPVLRKLSSAHVEAQWIVTELRRCIALTGELLTFNDFAILLRSASLSRHVESALGKAGIPYRMVGGHRFYDRVEVKILLDYLRVINQPENNDALARVVNIPSRRIGEATVKALLEEADQQHITLWALILDIAQGNCMAKTKLARQTEQGLSSFVGIILKARDNVVDASPSTVELIEYVMKKISFEDYLERTYSEDHEARLANVQELLNLAADFAAQASNENDEALPAVDGLVQNDLSNPLSRFLANIALASDAKAVDADSEPKAQIMISTIHAAKGLEWPVVFIPAAYQGSIPHSRSDDDDEERRLLYVAMTRAKALLYLSVPLKNSRREQTTLSPFLSPRSLKPYFSDKGPTFTTGVSQSIAQILRRPAPSQLNSHATHAALESLEDDLWPVDGEAKEEMESRWTDWDGTHHYNSGQQPPKRQRLSLDDAKADAASSSRSTWTPSYTTTMAQSTSVSALSVNGNAGFVSAGSHLKVLSKQSMNCLAEKTAPKLPGKPSQITNSTSVACEALKFSRVSSARSTKRPAGQVGIASFFNKTTTPSAEAPEAPSNRRELPPVRAPFTKSYPLPATTVSSTAQTTSKADTLPLLSAHRLGSAQLRAPVKPRYEDAEVGKKAYVFLSSSPQPPETSVQYAEDATEDIAMVPKAVIAESQPSEYPFASRPAQTMHITSMARLNTLSHPPPRRTLGVKRSLNGWSDRVQQGFKAPAMKKHF